jgi:DNA-directed RNA polymerase I, II, and III subunit RPABC2
MDEKYAEDDYEKTVEEDSSEDDSTADTGSVSSESEYVDKNENDDESIASIDDDEDDEQRETKIFKKEKTQQSETNVYMDSDEDDEDEDDDEDYLQKFDESLKQNIIVEHHPEMQQHNYDEIESLCVLVKDSNGTIIDPLHRTLPFLTKYERARILGERAKQINAGAKPFIKVENNVIDGYLIALSELEQKMIPFIIKRPLPNGGCEYWRLRDLEMI